MATLVQQIPALLGVLVGVLATFATTALLERLRSRHYRSARLAEQRIEAYAEFAHALKQYAAMSRRLAAARGLITGPIPVDPTEAVRLLAEAERDRGAKWERVLLLGDTKAIEAGRDWIVECWRIEWIARGLLTGDDEWHQATAAARRARAEFYRAARQDLGIAGHPLEHDGPHPRFPAMDPSTSDPEIPEQGDGIL